MTRCGALASAIVGLVLVSLAGCSNAATPATATSATPSKVSGSSSPADALVGTWQTADIPAASWVATYRRAGGTQGAAAHFQRQLGSGGGKSDRVIVRLSSTDWLEFEQSDDQAPGQGWSGTYIVSGNTVRATSNDGDLICHIVYSLTLGGETLRIRVVSDEPAANGCTPKDLLAQKTIYQTAAFQRTG